MTCLNPACENHHKELGTTKFCPECGKPAVNAPPAAPVGKSIVAGDQHIMHSTVVHNTTHAMQPEVASVLIEQSKALTALAQSKLISQNQQQPSDGDAADDRVRATSEAIEKGNAALPAWFVVRCPSCNASTDVPEYDTSETYNYGFDKDPGVKFTCFKCHARIWARKTNHSVRILGPKDRGYSNAEDPLIGDDKKCKTCKHFVELDPCAPKEKDYVSWGLIGVAIFLYCIGWMKSWFWGYWHPWGLIGCVPIAAIGLIRTLNNKNWHKDSSGGEWCGNQTARESCDRDVERGGYCSEINPNQRCKFWEPR